MKSTTRWDDLACFCVVARLGNLTHAARQLDSSAATLGRRMKAPEARMGRRLFLHGAEGYVPSREGRALLERVAPMERAAAGVAAWQAEAGAPGRVRISAGTRTSLFLAGSLGDYWQANARSVPEFVF